ncbi:TetR family transcriptional regulator [Amycolatopsis mediterranei S699]|uniref:TetR family transcriptional regulator n=2 Tax=Amycolatopsis mediterranei TaxID=33910 RepID=A0A0H3DAQ1_AMYMU|nr:TetR family transcriptional regulator [Amycolatopsis mediterranei U32]AEK44614.1 TetR family transcriptional regulator [Amycolatopsis mediterranei S699]AFO79436.1 TetR family transcriptional regulator [Amycolatopsis mediterranei S699]AGT86564.1 TetR family transcriptional regulator [Amycolatopsis mediterranei RB]
MRAELTRQRILTAAAHVFADHGYSAGTTNRIAERAGISIGSLYQYFPNKDAILAELLTRHLDDGTAALAKLLAGPLPGPIEEVFRVFVRLAVEAHLDDPHLLRMLREQAPRSNELIERLDGLKRTMVDHTRVLLEGHPEVHVADTATAARLIFATVELAVHDLLAEPDPTDARRLEDEMVAMLTRYVRG